MGRGAPPLPKLVPLPLWPGSPRSQWRIFPGLPHCPPLILVGLSKTPSHSQLLASAVCPWKCPFPFPNFRVPVWKMGVGGGRVLMKLRVFCSFRVGVRLEATGVRAECRCHLSPPPPLCGRICGEFLISQALGCLHTSQPQASQEALPVGGKEGGRDVLSCPGHSLAFATLSFLQPPSPSSWGLRAGNRTHTSGASQDSGVPTDLSIPGEGEVAEDQSWRVSSHRLSAAASRLPDSQAG